MSVNNEGGYYFVDSLAVVILILFCSHEHFNSNYCLNVYESGVGTEWINLTENRYFPTNTSQRACAKMKS